MNDREYEELAPLEVGDVLATTFRAIGASPGTHLGLATAVMVPSAVIGLVMQIAQYHLVGDTADGLPDPTSTALTLGAFGLASIAIAVLSLVANMLFQGALMRVTVEHVRGCQLGAREALSGMLPRFLPYLGASFLVGVAVTLGSLLCLLPGILAYVWLIAALPAAACEKIGPLEAMQRSVDLTEGNRTTIFLVGLVIGAALVAITFCVLSPMMISAWNTALTPGAELEALRDPLAPVQLVSTALLLVVQIATLVVTAAVTSVIYAKLRGLRDGVDASAVAQVFA